jgi:hypothetical protein
MRVDDAGRPTRASAGSALASAEDMKLLHIRRICADRSTLSTPILKASAQDIKPLTICNFQLIGVLWPYQNIWHSVICHYLSLAPSRLDPTQKKSRLRSCIAAHRTRTCVSAVGCSQSSAQPCWAPNSLSLLPLDCCCHPKYDPQKKKPAKHSMQDSSLGIIRIAQLIHVLMAYPQNNAICTRKVL